MRIKENALERLGFDDVTAAVYRQMVSSRVQSITELAAQLDLPEADLKGSLDQLELLDLLRPDGEGLGRLVDPQLALNSLLLRQISGIDERLREFEEDRAAVNGLLDQFAKDHPDGLSVSGKFVVGHASVIDRLQELADTAEHEWLAFVPAGNANATWLRTTWSLGLRVGRRGIVGRAVYTDSVRGDSRTPRGLARFGELGIRVRTVPSLPAHMLLVDRSLALLPGDPDDPCNTVMEITAPGVVGALTALFEGIWEDASPLGAETYKDTNGLTPQESELLKLLSRGLTDEAARRRLGVSLRTVRRMVADLSTRLGAESRFAVGYWAAKRGWV
ncbi:helix-turn-helix transcriptional regulator [Streptomyces boninensis]|uniref:helix-turn-helix transcriptional regulator n=1 Tax=Streptomyces boninensis TaxID=2039455 RepID=UPI003B20F65B